MSTTNNYYSFVWKLSYQIIQSCSWVMKFFVYHQIRSSKVIIKTITKSRERSIRTSGEFKNYNQKRKKNGENHFACSDIPKRRCSCECEQYINNKLKSSIVSIHRNFATTITLKILIFLTFKIASGFTGFDSVNVWCSFRKTKQKNVTASIT